MRWKSWPRRRARRSRGGRSRRATPDSGAAMARKIQLALHGDKNQRGTLLREPNKLIHGYVVRNAQLQLDEVVTIARMTTVAIEVLTFIASRREWAERPEVALALVRNPRTPVPLAIRMLDHIIARRSTPAGQAIQRTRADPARRAQEGHRRLLTRRTPTRTRTRARARPRARAHVQAGGNLPRVGPTSRSCSTTRDSTSINAPSNSWPSPSQSLVGFPADTPRSPTTTCALSRHRPRICHGVRRHP